MIRDLLTFPARAAARAAWAFVSTEPVPTILFGAEEPFDDDPRYAPGMTLTVPYDEELADRLVKTQGKPASVETIDFTSRIFIDGREVARRVQGDLA